MVRVIVPHLVVIAVGFLVQDHSDDTVFPAGQGHEQGGVKFLLYLWVSQRMKWRAFVDQFLAVKNRNPNSSNDL
jgi:hypothetical protein